MTVGAIRGLSLWRYGSLAVPIAFAGFPLYVLAPDYYATTHGISLTTLGLLLLGLRAFDAVQDPLIGRLSDRYRQASPWFMGAASIALCVAVYGLFNHMPGNPVLWFALCIAVAVTAYSVLSINLNTLGALWTHDRKAQTRISALREACGLAGLLIAVSLPSLLRQQVGDERTYLYFSMILFGLMLLAWLAFLPWLSANLPAVSSIRRPSASFAESFRSLAPATRYFLGIYALSMLASSIPAVLVIFFVRDLLGAESLTGVFLLIYFLSGAISMPLWKAVSARTGKYRAWALSMLLAVGGFVWAFFLGNGDIWEYAAICAVSGFALGADLALPPSILADHIHQGRVENHAATHYALLALAAKLSLAVASAVALPILSHAGFMPGEQNSPAALFALSAAYALVPCALKLGSAAFLFYVFIHRQQGEPHEKSQINRPFRSTHHA